MLSRKITITGLVFVAGHAALSQRLRTDVLALPTAVLRPGSSISVNESHALVRIRLVEELRKPGSAASVSLQAGPNEVFMIEVKRSVLSVQILAAAFAIRPHLAATRSKHPNANVVVYIPGTLSSRNLSPSDQLMFERLMTELKGHAPGDFIEVSGH